MSDIPYIDRSEFERMMRETMSRPLPDCLRDDAAAQCQWRGNEIMLQFALWTADEKNRGTEGDVLFAGATRILGNIVANFAGDLQALDSSDVLENLMEATYSIASTVADKIADGDGVDGEGSRAVQVPMGGRA